jgi:hypothetical protein
MKYTELLNKHDKDPNWDEQVLKEKRIKYLESELGSKDRLDGWTVEGLQKELNKLKNKI